MKHCSVGSGIFLVYESKIFPSPALARKGGAAYSVRRGAAEPARENALPIQKISLLTELEILFDDGSTNMPAPAALRYCFASHRPRRGVATDTRGACAPPHFVVSFCWSFILQHRRFLSDVTAAAVQNRPLALSRHCVSALIRVAVITESQVAASSDQIPVAAGGLTPNNSG
jgi:hypothetical protein